MPLTWDGTSIVASEALEERDMYSAALGLLVSSSKEFSKPEDHWSCIAHLSAEDILKSAVIEEKKLKRSPLVPE